MDAQSTERFIKEKLNELNRFISQKDEINSQRVLQEFIHLKPSCKVKIKRKKTQEIDKKFFSYVQVLQKPESIATINEEIYKKLISAGNSEEDAILGATGTTNIQEAVQKIKEKYRIR